MRRHVVLLRARWAAVPRWARLVLAIDMIGFVRREVAYLAVAVMACDIPANWSASWPSPPSWAFFVDGAFVFATAVPLLRVMPRGRERPEEAHALPC